MRKLILISLLLLGAVGMFAQDVVMSYEAHQVSPNRERVYIYIANNSGKDVKIGSFTMSLAHDANGVADLNSIKSPFRSGWDSKYESTQDINKNTSYVGGLSKMLQYGNADPTPGPAVGLSVPGNGKVVAMIIEFANAGTGSQFYLESAVENVVNNITDIDGNNVPFSVAGFHTPSGVFPVELSNFTATALAGEKAQLDWTTTLEINFSHFEIEKSADGELFSGIAKAQGLGVDNLGANYTYVDESSMLPVNYYRLRMVDLDGSIAYSDVVQVYFDANKANAISSYPNPVSNGILNLKNDELLQSLISIAIVDQLGRVVFRQQVNATAGNDDLKINVNMLTTGVYQLYGTGIDGERSNVTSLLIK